MPTISGSNLNLLRSKGHRASIFMSVNNPITLWSSQINDLSVQKGATTIAFDNGSGLNFTAIAPIQIVYFGTTAGGYDIGIGRVRSIASGTGGADGTLTIARNALDFSNNLFITHILDYRLLPKYPLMTNIADPENVVFNKDGDITYTDQNENTQTVTIGGENRANFIDPTLGYWEVESQLPDSYTTASGATITTYGATVFPTAGATINVAAGTGVGWVRFDTPGIYWVRWYTTDSNGNTTNTYRWYYAHSPDPTDPHYPTIDFNITQISGDWNRGGWQSGIAMHDKAALDEIPDKTGAIIWQVASYDGTDGNITFLPDNSNTLINGYVRKEKIETDISDGKETTDFQIETVDAVLRNHYMFSVSLAARPSPSEWYEFNNGSAGSPLTIPLSLLHFWYWHSTLFSVADVFLGDNLLARAYAEMEDGNLYSMVDDLSMGKGIRAKVVCDKGGRVHLTYDVQLLTDTERLALDVVQAIEMEDRSGDITIVREPYNRTAFVKTSGFAWNGTFSSEGCPEPPCPDVEPLCASAPGDMPGDEGANIIDFDRQVFEDQAHANALAGRFYAQLNNEFPEVRINFHGNYLGVLDVAYPEFWTLSVAVSDTVREFEWVNKNLICRTVTATIDVAKGTIVCNAMFEPEQDGFDGVAGYCLDEIPETHGDPIVLIGGDFEAVAFNDSGSCYVKSGTNWSRRDGALSGTNILDNHGDEDPFWRSASKQNSNDPADAILIKGNDGALHRTMDEGVNWSDITPGVDPPNNAGDSPAPTAVTVDYMEYEGDPVTINRHYVLVSQEVGGGEWRAWIYMSDDDFVTDTWVGLKEIL